jgi:hypothetical protein
MSLLFQASVTSFSFLYFLADLRSHSRKPILLKTFAVSMLAGAILGYLKSKGY